MSLTVDIKKKLGAFRLNVKFEADDGVLALLGASGCGKSMTLKCIAGIETPDEGRIVLNGRTLYDSEKRIDLPPQKRRVGYLFQQYALFPNMTVRQNIAAALRGRRDAEAVVSEKISSMRLEGLEDKRPAQLSGGQQQRVALARILASEPEALLLDEPFSALDSYLRWELEIELADTLRSFGRTAVFVSHSRDEVYRLCDKVCVLANGVSEKERGVKELFERPDTLASCILSGCKNFSVVVPDGEKGVKATDWGVTLKTGERVGKKCSYIGVRQAGVRPAAGETVNTIECTVERAIEDEFSYVFILSTPGSGGPRSKLRMELDKRTGAGISSGERLAVHIAPSDIMLLRK